MVHAGAAAHAGYGDGCGQQQDGERKTMEYFIKNQPGRTIRKVGYNLNPTYSINSNEYRGALRVVQDRNYYDYHFMIQLNDGKWADKPGESASRLLGYLNPTTYDWGTYNSDVVYFAVSR